MKISIVTPSFNQLEYIKLCAASVADQECDFEFEHLIEDACTGAEFDAWASEQAFASVRSQPDKGMYDAINNGFDRAQGEILAWLNCDEQYLPGTLQKVADWFAENPDKDVLFGDVVLVNQEGEPISYRSGLVPWTEHIKHCFLPTYSAAMFIRKGVLHKIGDLDTNYKSIADAVWVLAVLGEGISCGVIHQPLSTFVQYGGNMGLQEGGSKEAKQWRQQVGADGTIARTFWANLHRVRKMLRGDYQEREVIVDIYQGALQCRVSLASHVSGKWKRQ